MEDDSKCPKLRMLQKLSTVVLARHCRLITTWPVHEGTGRSGDTARSYLAGVHRRAMLYSAWRGPRARAQPRRPLFVTPCTSRASARMKSFGHYWFTDSPVRTDEDPGRSPARVRAQT